MQELAGGYEASLEATARRYIAALRQPAALLILGIRQKPTQYGSEARPQLRVQSTLTNGDWPFIPRYKSASEHGPFGRALMGEVVHEMTSIADIVRSSEQVEVNARLYPFWAEGELQQRVIALLRRPRR